MKTPYLHIGTHKTGTTSFQVFALRFGSYFAREGYLVLRNPYCEYRKPDINFGHFANAVLRPDLLTGPRLQYKLQAMTPERRMAIISETRVMIDHLPFDRALISSETLSFVRSEEEIDLIREGFSGYRIVTVCTFRERAAFLASFRNQIMKQPSWNSMAASDAPRQPGTTLLDLEDDSWLTDYDRIRTLWRGLGEFREINYERAMADDGSVSPSLLRAIDAPEALHEFLDRVPHLNQRVEL